MQYVTTLEQFGKSATGLHVPDEVVDALGGGRKPGVAVTVNGFTFRTTLGVMAGRSMVPVSAERRAAAGLTAGDDVSVEIVLDTAPREVEVPDDLAAALEQHGLRARFDALAPSHRKEHVRAIVEAKAAETRARRVTKAIEKLQIG